MKNLFHSIFASLFILTTLTFNSCAQQSANRSPNVLKADEFESKIKSEKDVQLVDVRTPGEFNSGHIKGFVNIDWQGSDFTTEISKLDKNKPTFIHCKSGRRSAAASEAMNKLGFKTVYDLQGGITSWSEAGKPIE